MPRRYGAEDDPGIRWWLRVAAHRVSAQAMLALISLASAERSRYSRPVGRFHDET